MNNKGNQFPKVARQSSSEEQRLLTVKNKDNYQCVSKYWKFDYSADGDECIVKNKIKPCLSKPLKGRETAQTNETLSQSFNMLFIVRSPINNDSFVGDLLTVNNSAFQKYLYSLFHIGIWIRSLCTIKVNF